MNTNLTFQPALLTREEAAAYLARISTRKLDDLQAEGRITPRALDGTRCYLRRELDEFSEALPVWETKKRPA